MTRHFRILAIAIAGLLSACAYHLASPIADFDSRLAEPPVPVGRYCGLTDEDELDADCAVLVWHADTRMFEMQDEGGEPPTSFALVALGEGLVAAEVVAGEMPYPYQVYLFVYAGDAAAFLPMADDADALALAAQFPEVELSGDTDGIYVTGGPADSVRAYLAACGRLALAQARAEGEDLDVIVHAPEARLAATPEQLKSRERLLALAARLADEAPGIDPDE